MSPADPRRSASFASQAAPRASESFASDSSDSRSFGGDRDLKERVREAVDIVDVVGTQLELRPQGRNFVATCPWHNDRRPSMTVNPERQTWKCWVCDIGGDVFSFVMRRDGLDFFGAVKQLAEQAGIPIDTYLRGPATQPGQPDDKETLRRALEFAVQTYSANLNDPKTPDAKIAADYLRSRGVSEAMSKTFQIGFAADEWSDMADQLVAQKNSHDVIVAAGLHRRDVVAMAWWICFAVG